MRLVFALLLVTFYLPSLRAAPFASIGTGAVFNYESDGRNYRISTPLNIRGGWRFEEVDALLEFSRYSVIDDVAVVSTRLTHSEWTFWGRHIFNQLLPASWPVQPFAGAGLGITNEIVETNFNGQSTKDEGVPRATFQTSVGMRSIVFGRLNLELEGRMGVSPAFAPNPLFAVGANAGWTF